MSRQRGRSLILERKASMASGRFEADGNGGQFIFFLRFRKIILRKRICKSKMTYSEVPLICSTKSRSS